MCLKKNSYIFLHNNDCKTPYIDIYIDLLPIITLIYSLNKSAIKFTLLTPGNVCVQAEGMLKPMKTLVLIQHHVERIL